MPQTIYRVRLSDAEREHLEQLLRGGTTATRQLTHGRILLKAAEGWPDERITEALTVGRATVERTRRRFVECGLEALRERPRPGQRPKARLIAEACSAALEGRQHWTLQLLADRVVALGLTESCPSAAEKNAAKKRQEKQPYVRYYLPRHSRIGRVGKLFFSVVVFIES